MAAKITHHHRNNSLNELRRSLTKNSGAIIDGNLAMEMMAFDHVINGTLDLASKNADSKHEDGFLEKGCPLCSLATVFEDNHYTQAKMPNPSFHSVASFFFISHLFVFWIYRRSAF